MSLDPFFSLDALNPVVHTHDAARPNDTRTPMAICLLMAPIQTGPATFLKHPKSCAGLP